ncbi:hypothetical protein F5Y16DRAFT_397795 [Xylariaceae sp. FL0255]|nr:hypothetical protein F5Y16DRAFT_397795 [Xylariaceae sp. FL0255]
MPSTSQEPSPSSGATDAERVPIEVVFNFVMELLRHNPKITSDELIEKVEVKTGHKFSEEGVRKIRLCMNEYMAKSSSSQAATNGDSDSDGRNGKPSLVTEKDINQVSELLRLKSQHSGRYPEDLFGLFHAEHGYAPSEVAKRCLIDAMTVAESDKQAIHRTTAPIYDPDDCGDDDIDDESEYPNYHKVEGPTLCGDGQWLVLRRTGWWCRH